MSSYRHPNLSSAIHIDLVNTYVYIYQELAVLDISQLLKTRALTRFEIHKWSNELCQAVNCMHNHGTIHCDIKPDNILLYENGSIKLADFTLSKLKMRKDDKFDYNICALNYRPPEVLGSKFWSESVDIWSLACTIYEMITRTMLIPRQVTAKIVTHADKTIARKLTLLSIIEWRKTCNDPDAMSEKIVGVNSHHQIKRIALSDDFFTFALESEAHRTFTEMIIDMLSYNPDKRPSIDKIISCSYYSEVAITKYTIIGANVPDASETKNKILSTYFARLSRCNQTVINMTRELFLRSSIFHDDLVKIDTCMWIAHKVVNNAIPDYNMCYSSLTQILDMEKKILQYLMFNIHFTVDK